MAILDAKLKHLEIIQGVINRMASNSFVFKGWSITIIAGITAFAAKDTNKKLIVVSMIASVLFWGVDSYYLMLERSFRNLYKKVAKKDPNKIDFLMDIEGKGFTDWARMLFRPVLIYFYGFVLVLQIMAAILIWRQ